MCVQIIVERFRVGDTSRQNIISGMVSYKNELGFISKLMESIEL